MATVKSGLIESVVRGALNVRLAARAFWRRHIGSGEAMRRDLVGHVHFQAPGDHAKLARTED